METTEELTARNEGNEMNLRLFKRFLWMLTLFSLVYLLIIGRLAYIQLWATENFSSKGINLIKKSVQQRQQEFILHSGRGEITDRHGQAFTGKSIYVLGLFPLMNNTSISMHKLEEVARVLHVSTTDLADHLQSVTQPLIYKTRQGILELSEEEANEINKLNIPGILGLPYELRYAPEEMLAQHFIGYIGQNSELIRKEYAQELAQGLLHENTEIGISGLERAFQPFLQGVGPTTLAYFVDGKGYPLQGIEVKYADQENPFYPLSIETTLDYNIQSYVENALDKQHVKEGTVVVLDAQTSEILAMASRPNFSTQKDRTEAWENKALKRYPLGSVFKIAIAAAALEHEVVKPNQKFYCDGVLEGTNFHCWKKEGHGHLSFEEAFAQSCNIIFGQLAQELGPEVIEEYAWKLGLVEKNGWQSPTLYHLQDFKQLDGEEQGQVYAPTRSMMEREDPLYLLQTGIGQLDVQSTPLAVANMLATILRGGHKYQVKGVQSIQYNTGTPFYHFSKQKMDGSMISAYTAYQLQHLLSLVTEKGTASIAMKEKSWKAAGKTGTAQVLKNKYGSEEYVANHQWFAGYYPQNQPKYVIVSLTLNREANARNTSVDIFTDIVDWLDGNK